MAKEYNRDNMLEAIREHARGHIAKHAMNVEVYLKSSAGVGEHPDILEAIEKELKIIEDSADTLGATINKKSTGIYSDISITSFYGSHVISCAGNGGMLMLNSKKDYEKAIVLRSWGRLSSTIKDSENIKKRLNISLSGIDYDRKFVFLFLS